jgi:tRNA pseudouridine55 synthase
MNGILVIDKPTGITSHDVVQRVRRITGERSVGHLGTLDPMATGVLPLLLGKFTRLAQFFGDADKEYEGLIRFGIATDTYDAEGQPLDSPKLVHFTRPQLESAIAEFVGSIEQLPPPFSAKKVGGVPAYKLARKGKSPELKAAKVTIHRFILDSSCTGAMSDNAYYVKDTEAPLEMRFQACVSSGTYIRSLAHDLGQALGCGAHLASLRRTRSGEFALDQAIELGALEAKSKDDLQSLMLDPRRVLKQMDSVVLRSEDTERIRHGNSCNLPAFGAAEYAKVFDGADLIAIAKRVAGTLFQPKVVLV